MPKLVAIKEKMGKPTLHEVCERLDVYLDALRVGLTSKQSQAFARRVNTNARLETASAES